VALVAILMMNSVQPKKNKPTRLCRAFISNYTRYDDRNRDDEENEQAAHSAQSQSEILSLERVHLAGDAFDDRMSAVANEVAAIEWNHRNQIGEAQEEVYPSQPEEEVEEEEVDETDPEETEPNEPEESDDEETTEEDEAEAEGDEEDSEEEAEEEPEVTPGEEEGDLWTLKWRGKEIKATKEEVINMAQRNFDSTHKYQEAARLRKEAERELELLNKVRKGDKEALAQLAHEAGVDPVDLIDIEVADIEQGSAKPAEPFVSPEVDALMQEVAQDDELFSRLQTVEDYLPAPVVNVMAKDPETFYAIVSEVRSGDAEVVLPYVQKYLAQMDNVDRAAVTSNPDAYAQFYSNVKQGLIEEAAAAAEDKPAAKKGKKNFADAAVRKSGGRAKNRKPAEEDPFESDEAYQKILERLAQQA